MIRRLCHTYAAGLKRLETTRAWVVATFSGVLCVDEVYQGRLALLVIVDPATPRRGSARRLPTHARQRRPADQGVVPPAGRGRGIEPEQVITDGSLLYPAAVLAQIWPAAAHQSCLFTSRGRVTAEVLEMAIAVRKHLGTQHR
jgi:hypothetical protein